MLRIGSPNLGIGANAFLISLALLLTQRYRKREASIDLRGYFENKPEKYESVKRVRSER